MALEEKKVRHITNKTIVHITATSLTRQRAVRQPTKRSPLRLTNTSRSTNLPSACKSGGRINANMSCALTTCPSGGRNCPRVPSTIPRRNRSITNHQCASARSLAGFTRRCQTMRYCTSRTASDPVALARRKPLQMTKLLRPLVTTKRS